jgi:hypothetical protein
MYESASDRTRDGRAVGKDFLPLAETPDLQQLVLGGGGGSSKGASPGLQPHSIFNTTSLVSSYVHLWYHISTSLFIILCMILDDKNKRCGIYSSIG